MLSLGIDMEKNIQTRFSKHLRELRVGASLTQQRLSELSNIEYKHIQRLEGKNTCDIKLSTLEKLAKAFKMTVSELTDF